jgi:hypothetical protein
MKKTVHIALCTMIILGCKIPSASGGETTGQLTKFGTITEEPVSEQEGLTWSFDGNTLTIGGTGVMPDYGSDDRAPWYGYRYNITRVIIKQGVKSIGAGAFSGCASLPSITIPSSVTSIGWHAFSGCSSLTSITIPNSVTTIGSGAFSGCSSLTSITIPNSVTTIGGGAFPGSTSASTAMNELYSAFGGAFSGCSSLTSVTIGNSVTTIEVFAFSGCSSLTSVTIGNSVTTIGVGAFNGCTSLRNVVVLSTNPPSFTYKGYLSIHSQVFEDVPLSSVTLTVPKWCGEAYKNATGWKDFGLIIEVGESAGDRAPFTWSLDGGTLTISGTIEMPIYSLQSSPWYNDRNNITRVNIKEGVKSIGNNAFEGCTSLPSITIPNSVTWIGNNAFGGCSSLRNIVVLNTTPPAISSMGFSVFDKVTLSFATLTVPQGCREAYENATGWKGFGVIVEVGEPVGARTPFTWSLDGGTLTISGKGMKMPDYSPTTSPWYKDNDKITRVNIQDGVTTIGNNAFYWCSNLTSITIPNSVTTIGNHAFYWCSNLTSITIPNSVTTIGGAAFWNCSSLTSITIPNSVTTIGGGTFGDCRSLTSITIPNSVTTIGSDAFYGCSSLKNVVILRTTPPSVKDGAFGSGAFGSGILKATLTVPKGSKAAYKKAEYWKRFGRIVEMNN